MPSLSGFVVSFNREDLVETCLRSIRFVDELIVFDKSSTDGTAQIAARYADRVISVPWSPVVEETRAAAAAACTHDRIVFLDDDECFSPEAIVYLNQEVRHGPYDLFDLPCRHYILGRHEEQAYYWPNRGVRAFKRGSMIFRSKVHDGQTKAADAKIAYPNPKSGICFHNLSHADAKTWVDKANRYTSLDDRVSTVSLDTTNLLEEARRSFDLWVGKCASQASEYEQAVIVLRAAYDMIDLVKLWEQRQPLGGTELFRRTCLEMSALYDELEARTGLNTRRSA